MRFCVLESGGAGGLRSLSRHRRSHTHSAVSLALSPARPLTPTLSAELPPPPGTLVRRHLDVARMWVAHGLGSRTQPDMPPDSEHSSSPGRGDAHLTLPHNCILPEHSTESTKGLITQCVCVCVGSKSRSRCDFHSCSFLNQLLCLACVY